MSNENLTRYSIGFALTQARRDICQLFEWSKYKERRLKFWNDQWIEHRDLPLFIRGKHPKVKSLLQDEDAQNDILEYLRQHPLKIGPSFLCRFLEDAYFPNKFDSFGKKSISRVTSQKWLHKLGVSAAQYTKGVYIDGHERKDVVEYRGKFLAEMRALEQVLVCVDDNNPEGPNIIPQIPAGSRPHIIVTHDECIFRAHDGKGNFWTKVGRSVLIPKGPEKSIDGQRFHNGN